MFRRNWIRRHDRKLLVAGGTILLLIGLFVAVRNQRIRVADRRDISLSAAAEVQQERLSEFFAQSRRDALLLARNGAITKLNTEHEAHAAFDPPSVAAANDAMLYLEQLYPGRVSEVCLIHNDGHEIARVVKGRVSDPAELAPDESSNPFFSPTLALKAGEVYQSKPYRSPDTGEWVVSTSTPIGDVGDDRSIVHFEVSLGSLQTLAARSDRRTYLFERDGTIIADSRNAGDLGGGTTAAAAQFSDSFAGVAPPTALTIAGERIVVRPIERLTGNANEWFVGVAEGTSTNFADNIGLPSLLLLLGGIVLFGLAVNTLQESQRRMRHLAMTDSLTGLPNRVSLLAWATASLAAASRKPRQIVVMLIDLDRFKEINDTLGHHFGDNMLREVGSRLLGTVGDAGMLARLGGDEFVIALVLPPDSDEGPAWAQRITEALGQPLSLAGVPVHVGASIGIASYPEHGNSIEALLQHADTAMYQAKTEGVDYRVYSKERDHNRPEYLALAAELRDAIETDALHLVFQPKFEIATQRLVGFEALARWQHPTQGPIGPASFIGLSERTGLIRPISAWVMRAALVQLKEWQHAGHKVTLAVNISPPTLAHPSFVTDLSELLEETGAHPAQLVIELTERTIMEDFDRSLSVLHELRDMGVSIAIDDYGTGYSGLSYLRRLPISELKVDQSFVSGIATNELDRSIVASTIDLAHRIGLRVVAEGVENKLVLDVLRTMRCDEAQGYFLGKPGTAIEATASLVAVQSGPLPPPIADRRARRRYGVARDRADNRADNPTLV
jgi:diguanylate cyclase (GGDEF)-like protein